MVGVFSWNDVDVLYTFNFDLDLKLTFCQCHKRHYAINGYLFILSISHKRHYLWVKSYDFGYVCILNCVLERIAIYILGRTSYSRQNLVFILWPKSSDFFSIFGSYRHQLIPLVFYYGPEGRPYSNQRVRPSVRPSVHPSFRPFVTDYLCWRVVVCVRFSSETTWPISPMMIPMNWGNNVDVQRALHFDLDPSMTAGQGHEILQFCELFFLMGTSLCSLLFRNYSTDFSNDDTNQLREQCRCATCTSFWPWPLHDCRSRSWNTSILWIIFPDGY